MPLRQGHYLTTIVVLELESRPRRFRLERYTSSHNFKRREVMRTRFEQAAYTQHVVQEALEERHAEEELTPRTFPRDGAERVVGITA
jgi:hypothetical protein